jgi:hypothetical protein
VTLSDVRRLRFYNQIAPSIKPFIGEAELELGDLLADKGDGVTAAEKAVLVDASRLGLVLKALYAVFLRSEEPDPDLARSYPPRSRARGAPASPWSASSAAPGRSPSRT